MNLDKTLAILSAVIMIEVVVALFKVMATTEVVIHRMIGV